MKAQGILFLLCSSLIISACSKNTKKEPNPHRMELDNTSQYHDQNYEVYTLEGCEYIMVGVGNNRWGSHKGNCKNPIHQSENQEIKLEPMDNGNISKSQQY
jgi:hypothetical protein